MQGCFNNMAVALRWYCGDATAGSATERAKKRRSRHVVRQFGQGSHVRGLSVLLMAIAILGASPRCDGTSKPVGPVHLAGGQFPGSTNRSPSLLSCVVSHCLQLPPIASHCFTMSSKVSSFQVGPSRPLSPPVAEANELSVSVLLRRHFQLAGSIPPRCVLRAKA